MSWDVPTIMAGHALKVLHCSAVIGHHGVLGGALIAGRAAKWVVAYDNGWMLGLMRGTDVKYWAAPMIGLVRSTTSGVA